MPTSKHLSLVSDGDGDDENEEPDPKKQIATISSETAGKVLGAAMLHQKMGEGGVHVDTVLPPETEMTIQRLRSIAKGLSIPAESVDFALKGEVPKNEAERDKNVAHEVGKLTRCEELAETALRRLKMSIPGQEFHIGWMQNGLNNRRETEFRIRTIHRTPRTKKTFWEWVKNKEPQDEEVRTGRLLANVDLGLGQTGTCHIYDPKIMNVLGRYIASKGIRVVRCYS